VYCVQAVDGSLEPVTSCVRFYGEKYDSETVTVLEHVRKEDGPVSDLPLVVCLIPVLVIFGIDSQHT